MPGEDISGCAGCGRILEDSSRRTLSALEANAPRSRAEKGSTWTYQRTSSPNPTRFPTLSPIWSRCAIWLGYRKGIAASISSEADGSEWQDYYARIEMQPIDAQTKGPQLK